MCTNDITKLMKKRSTYIYIGKKKKGERMTTNVESGYLSQYLLHTKQALYYYIS